MHQNGLHHASRFQEAAEIQKWVMDRYYPQTLAGANCAMNYALYVMYMQKDYSYAEGVFLDILLQTRHNEIIPFVKKSLALVNIKKRNYEAAFAYIMEVLHLVDEEDKGIPANLRQDSLRIKRLILRLMSQ